ncbi:hypothetical protein Tco_0785065, partial [Tanacetum coccineum]
MNMDEDRQMLMVEDNVGNQFRPNAMHNVGNQVVLNASQNPAPAEGNGNGINETDAYCSKEEAGIQLTYEEFEFMAAADAYDEIEKVTANYNLQDNLQQASTSGTQSDKAPVYDSDGSPEVSSVEQGGGTVEQHPANVEETLVLYDSLNNNLAIEVEKVNLVNHMLKETNVDLTTELARYMRKLLSKEKSTVSSLLKEKKKLKSDFKLREDELLDKQIQLENKIKELDNILVKTEAAKFVRDFKSLAKEADESLAKHKSLELEIERLLRAIVSEQKDIIKGTSANTKFTNQSTSGIKLYSVTPFPKSKIILKVVETNDLSKPVTSNSVPTPTESKVMTNDKVIAPGMLRINPFKTFTKDNFVPVNNVRASVRTNPIIVSQPNVITKKDVNSDSNGLPSTGVDNTAKTKRPQPKSNTKNDRVPSASKSSCIKNKEVEVEEHHKNLLLSKNTKHMSSECNNVKLAIWNDKYEVVYAMCKQYLITANHDVCVLNYVNGMNSANVSKTANQKKHKPQVKKPKQVGSKERLASPKPSKPKICLRWSPTGRIFDLYGKIIESSDSKCKSDISVCDDANTSNPQEPTIKRFPNSTSFLGRLSKFFLGTVRFGNDHVAEILGFGDLQWGIILITRVYFIEGLRHNLFSVGQFCNSDLEVAFRRNICFIRNLEGVDLLKGNSTTNLYTINLHEMAFASPICLMARATSTKSWLWHQRLSHLNFDTINDLA